LEGKLTKFGRYIPSDYANKRHERIMRAIQIDNSRTVKATNMAFDLSNYETVETRLARFWESFPDGRIETTLMNYDGESCIVRTVIWKHRDDAQPTATGYAHEIHSDRGVNATSFVENGETSSIGRCLANMGFATQGKRPSREEMQKVERLSTNTAVVGSGQRVERPQATQPAFATPKQQNFIKALAKGKEWDEGQTLEELHTLLGVNDVILETLSGAQASRVIEAWK
jgi:hypothetical protein